MYIQLESDYFGHPKTLALMAIIGPEADVYPLRLWAWAAKFAPKGVLDSKNLVEVACGWKGKPRVLLQALRACGFIERDKRTIHNWMRRTGLDLERYENKKERLRETYRKSSGNLPEETGRNPAVFGDSVTELVVTGSNGTGSSILPSKPTARNHTVEATIVSEWNRGPGFAISHEAGQKLVRAYIDSGMPAEKIHELVSNQPACKGRKLYEVLEPHRKKTPGSNGVASIEQILEKFGRGEIV